MNIDFVVTWLNSSDPRWLAEFAKYKDRTTGRTEAARFRNWDLFKYWFRAVEAYAPWVNKVFLVTNGKFPDWINENHPKLVLVTHSDYIPEELLPTFNSRTIELYIHQIPGLSEHFVYFNDDSYLNAPITPEYYFREGLPCDCNLETIFNVPTYTKEDKFDIYISMLADMGVINAHFSRFQAVRQSYKRWYGWHLGMKGIMRSLMMGRHYMFIGFRRWHWEIPFLKSTFEEVWEKEPKLLRDSCTRFREEATLNIYLFRYWQYASNRFYPVRFSSGKCWGLDKKNLDNIIKYMNSTSIKSLCLNDNSCYTEEYTQMRHEVQLLFLKKHPQKSTYEL